MMFSKELFQTGSTNIFVFGSNLAGKHGAGAAKFALQYCGAQYGNGFGLQGNSFAIPTKDAQINTLPLAAIDSYVRQFLHFVNEHPHLTFYVTAIGTGLAGYAHHQIAPLFADCPRSCILPEHWKINNDLPLLNVDNSI